MSIDTSRLASLSDAPIWWSRKTLALTFAVLAGASGAQHSHAADWYVDGKNGNDARSGSISAPFLNVWRAWGAAQAGDTIHLLPTVVYGPVYLSGKSGQPTKPIVFRGEGKKPALTQVSGQGINFGIYLADGVNYVRIENLDVTAPGHGTMGGWAGIVLSKNHHVHIFDNYVHDSGCSGVQTTSSDYVNISHNRIAHNAKDTSYNVFCSGVSTHENLDSDASTEVKMWIQDNVIHHNTNIKTAGCAAPCTNSDGNGIIIDDSRRTQTDNRRYQGGTVIKGNVVFNNGGRGVAVYYSDNVRVYGNTVYHNNKDIDEGSWRPGEIGVSFSGGVSVSNNIMFSDGASGTINTGEHVALSIQECFGGGPISADYNVSYNLAGNASLQRYTRNNAVAVNVGAHEKWGNPTLTFLPINPEVAAFQAMEQQRCAADSGFCR